MKIVLMIYRNFIFIRTIINISKKLDYNEFPKFLWVIRDFALSLVNNDGTSINSK